MICKPSRLALSAMAVVCAAIFAACNCAPTLRYLVVAPNNGTIYVSPTGGVIRGARAAASTPVRRGAATPQDITTAVCGTLQYAATGYYSNGTTKDQSSAVTWSSSSTSVATIGSNTGLAQGVGLGFTNIGATLGNITATVEPLEVDQLNSITVAAVAPVTNPLPPGGTQQFSATGNFTLAAGGTVSQDISGQVTWATGNGNVATIDQTGLVTAKGPGTTTVTATSCGGLVSPTASVTVTGIALVITPNPMTAATGTTVQFTAMENNNGMLQTPTSAVTWSSSATTVASINATSGLAQALTASTTAVTITATEANPSVAPGTASLTVQAAAARFAYLANVNGGAGSGSISTYIVNVGSSTPLTPNTNDPANPSGNVPMPANPQRVLLHPSGDLLFFIDTIGQVRSYCLNSTNGVISATTGQITTVSNAPSDIYAGVIDPTGRLLYVVTQGNGTTTSVLYGFKITHTPSGTPGTCVMGDAALTSITGLTAFNDGTLNVPSWIMTDQTGNNLYIVNNGNNTVSQYSISQAAGTLGQLTAIGTAPVATGTAPYFGTTDVNGHVFVANQGDTTGGQSVSAYTIGSDGSLSQIGSGPTPITVANTSDTFNVLASPNGNNLYVLDYRDGVAPGQVTAYGLTPATGVIGSVVGTTQATGVQPTGMAIDPTGALLAIDYADTSASNGGISLYTIGSSGAPTPTSPATVNAGVAPQFVVFYTAASGQ